MTPDLHRRGRALRESVRFPRRRATETRAHCRAGRVAAFREFTMRAESSKMRRATFPLFVAARKARPRKLEPR